MIDVTEPGGLESMIEKNLDNGSANNANHLPFNQTRGHAWNLSCDGDGIMCK